MRSTNALAATAAAVVGLILAFALGVAVGKDVGRSTMIIENLERDRAIQAYSDCILLRGKDMCVKPPELTE